MKGKPEISKYLIFRRRFNWLIAVPLLCLRIIEPENAIIITVNQDAISENNVFCFFLFFIFVFLFFFERYSRVG